MPLVQQYAGMLNSAKKTFPHTRRCRARPYTHTASSPLLSSYFCFPEPSHPTLHTLPSFCTHTPCPLPFCLLHCTHTPIKNPSAWQHNISKSGGGRRRSMWEDCCFHGTGLETGTGRRKVCVILVHLASLFPAGTAFPYTLCMPWVPFPVPIPCCIWHVVKHAIICIIPCASVSHKTMYVSLFPITIYACLLFQCLYISHLCLSIYCMPCLEEVLWLF